MILDKHFICGINSKIKKMLINSVYKTLKKKGSMFNGAE